MHNNFLEHDPYTHAAGKSDNHLQNFSNFLNVEVKDDQHGARPKEEEDGVGHLELSLIQLVVGHVRYEVQLWCVESYVHNSNSHEKKYKHV